MEHVRSHDPIFLVKRALNLSLHDSPVIEEERYPVRVEADADADVVSIYLLRISLAIYLS